MGGGLFEGLRGKFILLWLDNSILLRLTNFFLFRVCAGTINWFKRPLLAFQSLNKLNVLIHEIK